MTRPIRPYRRIIGPSAVHLVGELIGGLVGAVPGVVLVLVGGDAAVLGWGLLLVSVAYRLRSLFTYIAVSDSGLVFRYAGHQQFAVPWDDVLGTEVRTRKFHSRSGYPGRASGLEYAVVHVVTRSGGSRPLWCLYYPLEMGTAVALQKCADLEDARETARIIEAVRRAEQGPAATES